MNENYEYVQTKINQSVVKIKAITKATGISRYNVHRVVRGEDVKPFVIIALNDFFRKLGD